MKLTINRSYDPTEASKPTGTPYLLAAELELSPAETALVSAYDLGDYPLTYRSLSGTQVPAATVGKVIRGHCDRLHTLDLLRNNERVLRDAVAGLPELFRYLESFGTRVCF